MSRNKIYSITDLKLISVFNGMKSRCYNVKCPQYHRYGGRGIEICQEWLSDRAKFIEWSKANDYRADVHLDRINNDGDYSPSNCRWASVRENMRNRSNNTEHIAPVVNGIIDETSTASVLVRDLVKRAYVRRNKNRYEVHNLKKVIDEHYCFMEFLG